MGSDIADRVRASISAQEVADLAFELVKVPSPSGSEGAVARLYAERLEACGVRASLRPVEAGRPNVLGRLEGQGGGRPSCSTATSTPSPRKAVSLPDATRT